PAGQAFRMRVSMSATGSVMLMRRRLSPAGLAHAGDRSLQRELTETDAAQTELPKEGAAPATPRTAADHPALELRRALGSLDPTRLRHGSSVSSGDPLRGFATERPAELPKESHGQVIAVGRRHDRDVHAVDLLDLVVVDFREDHLLPDAERVVAPSVEAAVRQSAE